MLCEDGVGVRSSAKSSKSADKNLSVCKVFLILWFTKLTFSALNIESVAANNFLLHVIGFNLLNFVLITQLVW